jgi:hypothetical protein
MIGKRIGEGVRELGVRELGTTFYHVPLTPKFPKP